MSAPCQTAIGYRPCLVLASADTAYASEACLRLRRMGWDVYHAEEGPEVRRLARMLEPELVVLDAEMDGESGWLTCAKLKQERPRGEVVLVASEDNPRNRVLANFVGASMLMARQHGLTALLQSRWARASARPLSDAA